MPVLRSNFWLTIHVLTEVSSYAAFGVAWALGLIAMVYYLTATYRRSPRLAELALPLVPGIPLLATGGLGVAPFYGAFATQWATGDLLFYIFAIMGGIGGMISLGAILALVGELVNRLRFRETVEGEAALAPEGEFSAETGEPGFGAASSAALEQRDAPAAIRPGRSPHPPSLMHAVAPCRKPL